MTHAKENSSLLLLRLILRALLTPPTETLPFNLRLHKRASVPLPATEEPIRNRSRKDSHEVCNRPIHILRRRRARRRQDEDDADEQRPGARPEIDCLREAAHVPRTRLKLVEDKLARNGDDVAPVEGDGADVEDTGDGGVRAQADQVDGDAPEDREPHGVDRGASTAVDLGPEVRAWHEAVAGKGEDSASEGLGGGEADELQDNEGAEGVEDAACFSEGVEEDLGDGLLNG